jgi:CBS domain-containing protein
LPFFNPYRTGESESVMREFDSARRLFEQGVTVSDIATFDLVRVKPDWPAPDALRFLEGSQIDRAPIGDPPFGRYVHVNDVRVPSGQAGDFSRPISDEDIISANTGLAQVLPQFRSREFFYVREGDEITGIVTRADLRLPAVSMAVLGIVLALEHALGPLIDIYSHGDWMSHLSDSQRQAVHALHLQRLATNTDRTQLDCMNLTHRLTVVRGLDPLGPTSGSVVEGTLTAARGD